MLGPAHDPHLIKLCVGCDTIADLEEWIEETRLAYRRMGRAYEQTHTTRMFPKRIGEKPEAASLYWVIKSRIVCRQRLLEVRLQGRRGDRPLPPRAGAVVRPVRPRPMSPFQGWRYLAEADAPPDLSDLGAEPEMPEALRRELAGWGCCRVWRSPSSDMDGLDPSTTSVLSLRGNVGRSGLREREDGGRLHVTGSCNALP